MTSWDPLSRMEDNGVLAGSYWQTQCVKRDDSIRFLTLKLQEYTVTGCEMVCICKFQCLSLSIQFVCYLVSVTFLIHSS